MSEFGLKLNDRVNIITMHGMDVSKVELGTIVSIYKNGIYKVLPDSRKCDNCCYKFRPSGEQCGTSWKNYTRVIIKKVSNSSDHSRSATRFLTGIGVF